MKPNPTQRLAGLILGQPLDEWVTAQRDNGAGWGRIATDLALATEGQIITSGQTLRRWYAQAEIAA